MIIETGWDSHEGEPWFIIKPNGDGKSWLTVDRPMAVMLLGLIICVFGTKIAEDVLVTCEKYNVEEPPAVKQRKPYG